MRHLWHIRALLVMPLVCGVGDLRADPGLVVVMSAASGIESLNQDQVTNIFMGRFRQLPNGAAARPIDQPPGDPIRADFYQRLVHKQPSEIKAYWSRLIFSGKTSPPRQAKSREEIVTWLLKDPGAVGYLRPDQLDTRIKPVLDLSH
jgi:hypothetical protein